MKTTIKNLLRIDGSFVDAERSYGVVSYVIVHEDKDCKIAYCYNSKHNNWTAYLTTWNYERGEWSIKINVFDEIEEVIRQIYYITGYGHGII